MKCNFPLLYGYDEVPQAQRRMGTSRSCSPVQPREVRPVALCSPLLQGNLLINEHARFSHCRLGAFPKLTRQPVHHRPPPDPARAPSRPSTQPLPSMTPSPGDPAATSTHADRQPSTGKPSYQTSNLRPAGQGQLLPSCSRGERLTLTARRCRRCYTDAHAHPPTRSCLQP